MYMGGGGWALLLSYRTGPGTGSGSVSSPPFSHLPTCLPGNLSFPFPLPVFALELRSLETCPQQQTGPRCPLPPPRFLPPALHTHLSLSLFPCNTQFFCIPSFLLPPFYTHTHETRRDGWCFVAVHLPPAISAYHLPLSINHMIWVIGVIVL